MTFAFFCPLVQCRCLDVVEFSHGCSFCLGEVGSRRLRRMANMYQLDQCCHLTSALGLVLGAPTKLIPTLFSLGTKQTGFYMY
jgi:hypothetical protein